VPRIVDHEERRAEVLRRAFHVFDERGYGAVSMRDLARALGTSTGTLYHYFDGKEALFRALVQGRFESDLADATAELPDHAPPAVRLAHLAGWVGRNVPHLAATLRLVLDFQRQGGDDGFVRDVIEGYRGPLRDALGRELAGPGLSLVLGLLVHHLLDPEGVAVSHHLTVLGRLGE
jgi:AcrR family transcriptional regulator